MTQGTDLIAAERERQITEEGYDAEHDLAHADELLNAATAYLNYVDAAYNYGVILTHDEAGWPWEHSTWKPTGEYVRDLTKAGALIAAAIDSLEGTQ